MSTSTLRIAIAVILIAHGVGHYMGMLSTLGVKLSRTSSPDSWLFTNLLGDKGSRAIGFIIWLLALLGFIGAGLALLGLLIPQAWWQPLAVISAIISLVGLIFFWNAFAMFFNKLGAVGVNVAVLISLLFLRWPPDLVNK
jgi:hypothetical protein